MITSQSIDATKFKERYYLTEDNLF